MKLFPKSFERRRLFEKRRHPENFPVFYQCVVFKQSLKQGGVLGRGAGKSVSRNLSMTCR
ncbi:hypothetical protein F1645_10260 [Novacetimonas hansenii]